jgi:hypothetical protein
LHVAKLHSLKCLSKSHTRLLVSRQLRPQGFWNISVSAVKSVAPDHVRWTLAQHISLGVTCFVTLVTLRCLGPSCKTHSRLAAGYFLFLAAAAMALFERQAKQCSNYNHTSVMADTTASNRSVNLHLLGRRYGPSLVLSRTSPDWNNRYSLPWSINSLCKSPHIGG